MMGAVRLIPGSHFSNVIESGDLDAEAETTMTLAELEVWLALEIVGVYHACVHRALAAPPNAVWVAQIDAVSLRRPVDPRQFLIDFLPTERRVLQRESVFGARGRLRASGSPPFTAVGALLAHCGLAGAAPMPSSGASGQRR
ncbi:hypothetical protein [Bradyrhizobium sp. CCGUVB23]|uniref:hypothetical protein n=1 Tax=Bradyrhizobium sp. CCGUVB23 TaxID=2949630 RepID=UPI0020B198EB|nr:hypothetical protein [Bradyrhizobium sp. CCGUVB23]MCP3468481.1 hypothetical protein [Bradyrhizobium sp. CCGUVB23]